MTTTQTIESLENNIDFMKYDDRPLRLTGSAPQDIYVGRYHVHDPQGAKRLVVALAENRGGPWYLGGIESINPQSNDGPNYNTKLLTFKSHHPHVEFDLECDLRCSTVDNFVMCVPAVGFLAVHNLKFSWAAQTATTQILIAPNESLVTLPQAPLVLETNENQEIFVRLSPDDPELQRIDFALTPGGPYYGGGIEWKIQRDASFSAKVLTLMLQPPLIDIGSDLPHSPTTSLPGVTCVVVSVPRGNHIAEYHFDVYDANRMKKGIDPKIKPIPPVEP